MRKALRTHGPRSPAAQRWVIQIKIEVRPNHKVTRRREKRHNLIFEAEASATRQIEFWDCINRLEDLTDIVSDAQLWVERMSTLVTSGRDLTLAHVDDYLATGLIHVVSESWYFPNRELLLPELANAVNLHIKFRNALEQLKRLVDVKFDPAAWISTTSTVVGGGMDLTMADVDDYLVGSGSG